MAWSASEARLIDADRRACWRRFQRAVDDLLKGNKPGVVRYLREVEERAGREVAEATREQVRRFAKRRWTENNERGDK